MKDIGSHVGYTVLLDKVTNEVGAGMQVCYYPAAPPIHVMAVLSGTRAMRVLCVWVACYVGTLAVWRHVCASGLRPSVLGCVLWPWKFFY